MRWTIDTDLLVVLHAKPEPKTRRNKYPSLQIHHNSEQAMRETKQDEPGH